MVDDDVEDDELDEPYAGEEHLPVIHISSRARRHIRDRGGRVFIWYEDANAWSMVQKASTSAPAGAGIEFTEYSAEEITVYLHPIYEPPDSIRVSLRPWWPFQPLAVDTGLHGMVITTGSSTG
jgi:hypothetical protein